MVKKLLHDTLTRTVRVEDLPRRVRETVRERERANEVLVRIIQLGIVALFGLLYVISPKAFPEGSFLTVPYVLGAYMVLSIIGLIWSMRAELPDWSVYCSIFFDFSLLYGLMISFHFQYMQPASFILKAPTLLYVFIFIALRALRFEAKFVFAAGMVAAVGWLSVIFYVIRIDPGDNMLTRSYVEYLTSNSILIGAEVDKILSIVAVTLILTFSVRMSSNLLVTSIGEAAAARDLSRFFDDSVARNIRSSDTELVAGQGEHRLATILNIDIRNFTGLAAEMDPSRVMQVLSAYQSRIIPIVRAHGGTIDKFMGDGIMVTFGVEDETSDCAVSALRACETIMEDQKNWAGAEPDYPELANMRLGLGLATGTVSFGAVGRQDRLEMTVIGAVVNLSAKLEKHNKKLKSTCIACSKTWEHGESAGYRGRLKGDLRTDFIEGVALPMEIVVLELNPAETMPDLQGSPIIAGNG